MIWKSFVFTKFR